MTIERLPLDKRARQSILTVIDGLVLVLVAAAALWLGGLRSGWNWSERGFALELLRWLLLLVPLWIGLAWTNGLYDLRRMREPWAAIARPATVSAQLVVLWALAYFIPPPWTIVRHVVIFFALGMALAVPPWRWLYDQLFHRRAFRTRVLIVGAGDAGQAILGVAREQAAHLLDIVGFVDDDPALAGAAVEGLPVLADRRDLVELAQRQGVDEIVLAITRGIHPELFAALMEAQEQGIAVTPMPLLYEALTGRIPVAHIGDQWAVALPLSPPEVSGLYRLTRRTLDLLCALLGLVALLLLLPFLFALVRWRSPGPIFFRQTRVGRGGRPFTLFKLRTMRVDAEPDGPVWAEAEDPRASPGGRWLRRARLDELPQALNLLRGEMSIIGPRPERPAFVDALSRSIPFYRSRHALRPGLTGWAAVHQSYASTEADARVKLEYDLFYIKHRSLLLDALILARTAASVLRLAGR